MLSKRIALLSGSLLALAACGGGEKGTTDTTGAAQGSAAAAPAGGAAAAPTGAELTPDPGGKIITVQMETADTSKWSRSSTRARSTGFASMRASIGRSSG